MMIYKELKDNPNLLLWSQCKEAIGMNLRHLEAIGMNLCLLLMQKVIITTTIQATAW